MRRRKYGEPAILSACVIGNEDGSWLLRWTEDDGTARTCRPIREMPLETRGHGAAFRAQQEAARLLGTSLPVIGIG